MGRDRALLLALILVACDRAPAKESSAAPPVVEPAPAPTKIVVPTEAAPIVAAPPDPVEPAPPGATTIGSTDRAAAKPAPKRATKGAPPKPEAPAAPESGTPATRFTAKTLVTDKLYRIELAPLAPCKAAAPCEAKLVVHALGGYKVNAEYPSKFVATPAAGVTVEGTGAFVVGSKTTGTMTVTFRVAAAGTAKISGALKLSVCTDEICEIAAPVVTFDVPVS